MESLGAPSTLKLPLWDKASAEFCFAKSRELLTKPSAWTSYLDIEFNSHIFNNESVKQRLIQSPELLKKHDYKSINCGGDNSSGHQRDNLPKRKVFHPSLNLDIPIDTQKISTSYVDRYFNQSTYFDDDDDDDDDDDENDDNDNDDDDDDDDNNMMKYIDTTIHCCEDKKYGKLLQVHSNHLKYSNSKSLMDIYEPIYRGNKKSTKHNHEIKDVKGVEVSNCGDHDLTGGKVYLNGKVRRKQTKNCEFHSDILYKSDLDITQKIPSTNTSTKFIVSRENSSQGMNIDKLKCGNVPHTSSKMPYNSHESYSVTIPNKSLLISESDNNSSSISSSSESLRVNFQRLRRKSDIETKNDIKLNNHISTEKYRHDICDFPKLRSYFDVKKGTRFNLGFTKLTQNMLQIGKNIGHNSRNLESTINNESYDSNVKNIKMNSGGESGVKYLNVMTEKSDYLDIPIAEKSSDDTIIFNLEQSNIIISPNVPRHTFMNPELHENSIKSGINIDTNKSNTSFYRPRTSSLSDTKKSEMNIGNRMLYNHRSKKMSLDLYSKYNSKESSLYTGLKKNISMIEQTRKSPPPSTSFLNSLSSHFSSRDLISQPDSVPSSSITFTSNSELDSDTSSECPDFTHDRLLIFPPSPAP